MAAGHAKRKRPRPSSNVVVVHPSIMAGTTHTTTTRSYRKKEEDEKKRGSQKEQARNLRVIHNDIPRKHHFGSNNNKWKTAPFQKQKKASRSRLSRRKRMVHKTLPFFILSSTTTNRFWWTLLLVFIWNDLGNYVVKNNHKTHKSLSLFVVHAQPRPTTLLEDDEPTDAPTYSCNYVEDTCRRDWIMDGYCDNQDDREVSCLAMDCFDCDPCQRYSYSCVGCASLPECVWCPADAICVSQALDEDYWQQYPNKISGCASAADWTDQCQDHPDAVFGDALYESMQWMYRLVHVEEVWRQGIKGQDVVIRIHDDGLDIFHQELLPNFKEAFSCDEDYRFDDQYRDWHGTAAASLVAANNNGACSVGMAPDATLSSCNAYSPADIAFLLQNQLEHYTDVSCNSWPLFLQTCTIQEVPTQPRIATRLQPQLQVTCPFPSDHPRSPCLFCDPTFWSRLVTTEEFREQCHRSVVQYCQQHADLSNENDQQACDVYYWNVFVQCQQQPLDETLTAILKANVATGRQEKGVVVVIPSGDDGLMGGTANYHGLASSRFTMTVGSVGKDGQITSTSSPGSALMVVAPTGDAQYISNCIVARPNGGCRDAGYGTSLAVAVVSGIVALMLEVASSLTWRDVFAIVAMTATPGEDDENAPANGAGYRYSDRYGFGIINARAAVDMARNWTNFPPEEGLLAASDENLDLPISDFNDNTNNSTTVTTSTVSIEFINPFFRIESVEVSVELSHASQGDLQILLTSPGGSTSTLMSPAKGQLQHSFVAAWDFTTLNHFWEYPGGEWTLTISDLKPGNWAECIDYPWQYTFPVEASTNAPDNAATTAPETTTLTCADFASYTQQCRNETEINPELWDVDYQGRILLDACCVCGGGLTAETVEPQLKSWTLQVYGHVSAEPGGSTETVAIPESTCQFIGDDVVTTCPLEKQFNHVCDDNLLEEACQDGDCFDCDPCQSFTYDCAACTKAGCNYCPGDGICMSIALDESFWSQYPSKTSSCPTSDDWVQSCTSNNTFPDPLFDTMAWSYAMIDVDPVWKAGFTGQGVHIRINDDGVDAEHAEIKSKFDKENSCDFYLPYDNQVDIHGTACASIAAGNKNDHCAVGIAPGATISACVGPIELPDAPELLVSKMQNVDISSNSWGPIVCKQNNQLRHRRLQECLFSSDHPDSPCTVCNDLSDPEAFLSDECEAAISDYCLDNYEDDIVACAEFLDLFVSCEYHTLPLDAHESFVKTIEEGRGGKGIIYIFSAGNNGDRGADVNFNGFINSRFTIAVGAVGKDGKHASYSTTGAAVFVSAPGGDYDDVSGNIVARPGGGCHDITVGTSFAAPVVTGVIALMLQLNPALTWRDVQGIIALTSQQFDPKDPSWVVNAAGYKHSYKYGFGVIKTTDCMTRASTWKNFDKEKLLMADSGKINLEIADDATQIVKSSLNFEGQNMTDFITESVVVYLEIDHPSRGDLKIVLTSPSGTDAILHPSKRPENQQPEEGEDAPNGDEGKWKLLSLRTWGEYPQGDWTLSIADESPGTYGNCFNLPWEYSYERPGSTGGNLTLRCEDLDGITDCKDPAQINQEIFSVVFEGRSIVDSCCICGGGKKSEDIPSVLKSWKLLVYGHVIRTYEELLITPPEPDADSEDETVTIEEPPEGSLTFPDEPVVVEDYEIGADSNQKKPLVGGGGTAYWSGWREGERVSDLTTQPPDGSSGAVGRHSKGSFIAMFTCGLLELIIWVL